MISALFYLYISIKLRYLFIIISKAYAESLTKYSLLKLFLRRVLLLYYIMFLIMFSLHLNRLAEIYL